MPTDEDGRDYIFDLEEQMLAFANVTADIDLVTQHFVDHSSGFSEDDVMNKYLAIKELYEIKFAKMWDTFDKVVKEYHERGNL